MRILHAGDGDRGDRASESEPESVGTGHRACTRSKPLPLRDVSADREGDQILSSHATPEVLLDPRSGEFSISGSSFSSHSVEFYEPIIDFINKYVLNPALVTSLSIKLVHRNSATDKCIIQLVESVAKASGKSKITVKWHYPAQDGEEELEYAKSLADSFGVNFEFIPFS